MIFSVVKVGWLTLKRSPVELLLTFVVPIVFFSIFAVIFGDQGNGSSTPKFKVAFVDLDQTATSRRFVKTMAQEPSFEVQKPEEGTDSFTEDGVNNLIKSGKLDVAVILENGFASKVPAFTTQEVAARIVSDGANPMAPQVVYGLMQKGVMSGLQSRMLVGGAEQMSQFLGPLTEKQRKNLSIVEEQIAKVQEAEEEDGASASDDGNARGGSPINVKQVALIAEKKKNPMVSYYAAAIAVMFLLFSATGAGGALLDEMDNGTLERALVSQLGMTRLLGGKWLFLTILGVVQVTLMFLWGHLVFGGIDFFQNFGGFFAMTILTASAASGFGLVLASLCSSRAQLSGISTIVILTMSALGGSMFPRFLMSESLRKVGSLTFNGWAVDGYQGIFWYGRGIGGIKTELGVLLGMTVLFGVLARFLARRWETQ